jgi:hypothetical protein
MISFLFLAFCQWAMALTNSQAELDPFFNNIVTIKTIGLDTHGDEVPGYCNATFIAPQKLITAAHCVAQAEAMNKKDVEIIFGKYVSVKNKQGQNIRVGYKMASSRTVQGRFILHPMLVKKIKREGVKASISTKEDIAIIDISENLTSVPDYEVNQWASPLPVPLRLEVLKNIQAFNPKVVTVNFLSEMGMDSRRSAVLDSIEFVTNNFYIREGYKSKSRAQVQEGDSGAPLFVTVNGQQYIAGVVKGHVTSVIYAADILTALPLDF